MEELNIEANEMLDIDLGVQERLMKRQIELNKEFEKRKEKNELSSIGQIENFLESFMLKVNNIKDELKLAEELDKNELLNHFECINKEIQSLQNFYSNSTIFLRIYDKKMCQCALQSLNNNLQDLEKQLLPKKKFGFQVRKARNESDGVIKNKLGDDLTDLVKKNDTRFDNTCGFSDKNNEILLLEEDEVNCKDVLLSNISNCTINIFASPNTLHIANLESSIVYCGPVSTSVMIEKCNNSVLHLACQQLRIHVTTNTTFYLHVTSKAIIEDSTNLKFTKYDFMYKNIDKHFKMSNLNQNINNWDKVDDFNWLAIDKPSPNWSLLDESNTDSS